MSFIDPFYSTRAWRKLRYQVLKYHGARCQCCGSLGPLNVDHIKPRKRYPRLALSFDNLQVLCENCNAGKGGMDKTDWRNKKHPWFHWINQCPDPRVKSKLQKDLQKRAKKAVDEFVFNGGKVRKG